MNNPESYEQQQSQLNRHKQPNHVNTNIYMPSQSNLIFQHPASANSGMLPNQATHIVHVGSQPHPIAFPYHSNYNSGLQQQQQQIQYYNPSMSTTGQPVSIHQPQPHFLHSSLQSPISFQNNQLVVAASSLNQQEESSGSGSSSLNLSQASLPSLSSSHGGLISQPSPRVASPLPNNREPPRIISWPDLLTLLQNEPGGGGTAASLTADANVASRPYSGQMTGGQFFTPKSPRKDQYFFFSSKSDYISHFVHYYFSTSNMRRDTTLQSLLIDGGCLPVERLLLFPKLSQIETSEEDLVIALESSPKVAIVTLHDGRRAVKRIDNWSPTQSAGPSTPGVYDNVPTYTPVTGSNGVPNSGAPRMQLVQPMHSPGQVQQHAGQFQQGAVYAWVPPNASFILPHSTGNAESPHGGVHPQLAHHYAVSPSGSFLQQAQYPQHIVMAPTVMHHHQGSGSAAGLLHPQLLSEHQHHHQQQQQQQQHQQHSATQSMGSPQSTHYHSNSGPVPSQTPLHNWVPNH